MKKILSTIFIAILLIGFFSPLLAPTASADTVCTGTSANGTPIPAGCNMAITPCSSTDAAGFKRPLGCNESLPTNGTPAVTQDTPGPCDFIYNSEPYHYDNLTTRQCEQKKVEVTGTPAAGVPPSSEAVQKCLQAGGTPDKCNESPASATPSSSSEPGSARALFGQCWKGNDLTTFSVPGCLTSWGYWILVTIPSYILYETAYMFNVMLALTVGTVLYNNSFLPEAWRIVRDFSNIFFILVLLYIAIRMILGLGSDGKKMIVNVIIAALLINFSMFATELVIDSSNILALIFYNKIAVVRTPGDEGTAGDKDIANRDKVYNPVTTSKNGVEEKDIAAGIVSGFNPAHFINPSIGTKLNVQLDKNDGSSVNASTCAKTSIVPALGIGCFLYKAMSDATSKDTLPFAVALAIEVTACAVFLFAAYAFFMAALAFIGRLIELWILIIFSPFAFMSLSVPQLSNLEYFGFEKWLDRLLKISFMAPIFMFFLLLITKLVQIDIFKNVLVSDNTGSTSIPRALLILAIPAIIYLSMLYKATEWAKKHSGDFGEAVIKYGKMATAAAGSLALATASGGTSFALSNIVGRGATALKESDWFRDSVATRGTLGRWASKGLGRVADSSFDLRNTRAVGSIGKFIEKSTGATVLDRGKEGFFGRDKGGFTKRRDKRAKELEEYTSKHLDTTEQMKAQMTRGNMSQAAAGRIEQNLINSGMAPAVAAMHRLAMETHGLNLADLPNVVRHLDAQRRSVFGNRQEGREAVYRQLRDEHGALRFNNGQPVMGIEFLGPARNWASSTNMAANKYRQTVAQMTTRANMAQLTAALVASGVTPSATPPATPPGTPPAGGGGGGGGGGGAHP